MAGESLASDAHANDARAAAEDGVVADEPVAADDRLVADGGARAGLVLGGMALRDGVLLQSDGHWAAAVRLPDGTLRVRSGPRKHVPGSRALSRVPVARGVVRLGEAVSVLPTLRREMGLPVLPQEDPRLLAAAAGSTAATLLLRSSRRGSPLLRELGVAALTLGPALLAIRDSELSRMHGAEHKSVSAYEAGTDSGEASKEHARCGSNLIGPLLVTSTIGSVVLARLGKDKSPLAVLAAGLVSIGSAVELFAWMARHQGHPVADLLRTPGLQVQKLFTTREPSPDQLGVAQAALAELLRLEGVA
ncbi:MAG TPA: DUF1385 domain-containing protein [Thermoleophilia bacterium]|nr:DUF1385 domain-containing protein [Thermoleophilia bacterium]